MSFEFESLTLPFNRYTISERETSTGLVSYLLSSAVNRQDSGSFMCVTWNSYGQNEMTTRVLIEEVPDAPNEVIAYEVSSKSVSLRYSLPYSGNSPVIKYLVQWKKDKGKKIINYRVTLF